MLTTLNYLACGEESAIECGDQNLAICSAKRHAMGCGNSMQLRILQKEQELVKKLGKITQMVG